MTENKKHWYDGWFYDIFIAPNQDKAFALVKEIIKPNSSVLDVGCGTGRFSFCVADKCKHIDGIDLSEKNISSAIKNLKKTPSPNISFFHSESEEFLKNKYYDFITLSYVIHEVNEDERINLLKLLSDYSDKIIIIDYLVPRIHGITDFINEAVEYLAGKEHYRNFKSYVSNNGIKGLAVQSGLKITKEIINTPETVHIAVLQK